MLGVREAEETLWGHWIVAVIISFEKTDGLYGLKHHSITLFILEPVPETQKSLQKIFCYKTAVACKMTHCMQKV